MNGYSWLYLSLDWFSRTRLVDLSEPIDRTLSEGWHNNLTVSELYKGFAKFTDRFGQYYVMGKCSSDLKLGQIVDGLVRTEGDAKLLRDNLNRIWINTLPGQDLIGPYRSIEQAKSELNKRGLKEYKRKLAFYKQRGAVKNDQSVRTAATGKEQSEKGSDNLPF